MPEPQTLLPSVTPTQDVKHCLKMFISTLKFTALVVLVSNAKHAEELGSVIHLATYVLLNFPF